MNPVRFRNFLRLVNCSLPRSLMNFPLGWNASISEEIVTIVTVTYCLYEVVLVDRRQNLGYLT